MLKLVAMIYLKESIMHLLLLELERKLDSNWYQYIYFKKDHFFLTFLVLSSEVVHMFCRERALVLVGRCKIIKAL